MLVLSLLLISCEEKNLPNNDVAQKEYIGTVVLETDSDEWSVYIFKEHLLYSDAIKVSLPSPWIIPTKEDASILKILEYPHSERFVTIDGYTFGMPSASVSKAGAKTRYSVLGLHKKVTVINIKF